MQNLVCNLPRGGQMPEDSDPSLQIPICEMPEGCSRISSIFKFTARVLIICACFVLTGCVGGQLIPPSETLVMPTGTVTKISYVYMAELSPDGKHLVYCRATDDEKVSHVYISNADGTSPQQVTNSPGADSEPSWSPDGKRIIFIRAARFRPYSLGGMVWDDMDLWTVGANGNGEIRVTVSDFYQAGSPHFSPDSRRVTFWADRDPPANAPLGQPGTTDIAIGDLDRDGPMHVIKWMPTTAGPDGSEYFSALNRDPSFSPDGSTIAFVSNRVGNVSPFDYEIWLTDPAFDRVIQLTHLHMVLASPTFTSDGQHILFTAGFTDGGKYLLWQVNPNGSGRRQLR